jgi:YegS/Rv2252/BmrU family lipid kinase
MKVSCIVHGKKKHRQLADRLGSLAPIEVDIHKTSIHQDASSLTQKAISEGAERILAVGGDGTWNEVINGILSSQNTEIPCMLLPLGTANDWTKTFPSPRNIKELELRLKAEHCKKVDVGRITFTAPSGQSKNRYFINIADGGMGAAVVKKVNKRSKWMGPHLTFVRAIAETFISYKNVRVEMYIDDEIHQGPIRSFVVANGRFFGSGMCIAPHAEPDDGWFSIVIIGDVSLFDYLRYLPKIKRGEYIDHPDVSYTKARKVELRSSQNLEIEADGEYLGTAPARFEIQPAAIYHM